MAGYISVPKDLTKVKSKFAFGLTGKQLLCVVSGAMIAIPTFWAVRGNVGNGPAMMLLFLIMAPFAALAFYEKYGMSAFKWFKIFLRKNFSPIKRPYKTQNFYAQLDKLVRMQEKGARVEHSTKTKARQATVTTTGKH